MKLIIAQKCLLKALIAIIISFLWARFIRISSSLSIIDYPVIFFGAFYLMLAWFNYLKLDGLKVLPTTSNDKKLKKPKHKTKQMIDYVDTELQPNTELSQKDVLLTQLISNLICGIGFVLPSIFTIFTR